jgi:hypothetical protein
VVIEMGPPLEPLAPFCCLRHIEADDTRTLK